jgi:hypothetical protein
LAIPTIYQRLFYNFVELTDSSLPLSTLLSSSSSAESDNTIELLEAKLLDESVALNNLDDAIDEIEREKNRKGGKKKDEGFGGTGLLGFGLSRCETTGAGSNNDKVREDVVEEETERETSTIVIDKKLSKACHACTFLQSRENDECEVCGSTM